MAVTVLVNTEVIWGLCRLGLAQTPFVLSIFCGFCVEKSDFAGIRGKLGPVFVDKTQTKCIYPLSVRTSVRLRTYNKERP